MKRTAALLIGLGAVSWPMGADVFSPAKARTEPVARQLAQHLKDRGIRFYGSWSCPACQIQLKLFGIDSKNDVPYVECNKPEIYPEQARQCRLARLRVYPTWEHSDGRRLEGVQSLDTLRRWSGLN